MPSDDQQNKVGARISLDISPAQKQLLKLSDDLKKTFNDGSVNASIDQMQNKIKSLSEIFSEVKSQLAATNSGNTFIQNTEGQLVSLQNALKNIQLSFKEGKLGAEEYLKSLDDLRKSYADDLSPSNAGGFKNDLLLRNAVLQAQKEISSLQDFQLESERKLAQQQDKLQQENIDREQQLQAQNINNQLRNIREFYNMKMASAEESLQKVEALMNQETAYFEENETKKLEAMKLSYKLRSDLEAQQASQMISSSKSSGNMGGINTGGLTAGSMVAGMMGFAAVSEMYSTMVEGMKTVEEGAAGLHQVFEDQITSQDDLNKVTNDFIGIAQKYGQSIHDVMEGAKLWGRQYKDIQTAMTLTNSSTLLSVVDNVKLADSNRGLEATMNAMGLAAKTQSEAFANSMRIVDSWSELAHKASVSATDLVQATERSAGAAHEAGVNFDQLQALITSGVRNTGLEGANVGNMLKSLFASIHTENAEKALQNLNISLTQIGQNGEKQFRPIFDVLLELSQKLQTTDQSQQKLLETISGGKFQWSKVASMLSDYNTIIDAYATSLNSAGAAQQYAQAQMDTLGRDITRLRDTFIELTAQTSENGLGSFLKSIVEGLTDLIKGLEQMPSAAGQTLLVISGLLIGLRTLTSVVNTLNPLSTLLVAGFQKIAPAMTTAAVATEAETIATTELTGAFTALNVVSGGLALIIGAVVTGITMYAMSEGQATEATQKSAEAIQQKVGIAQQEYNLAQQKQSFMDTAIKQEQQLKKALEDTSLSADQRNKIMGDMVDLYHAVGKATDDEALKQVDASNIKNHSLSTEQDAMAQLVQAKKVAYEQAIKANEGEVQSDIARTNQLIEDMNKVIDGLSKETEAKLTELSVWDQVKVAFIEGGQGEAGFGFDGAQYFNDAVDEIKKNAHDKQLADAKEKLASLKAQKAQLEYNLSGLKLDEFNIDKSGIPDYQPALAVDSGWDSKKTKTKKPSSSDFARPYRNDVSAMQEDLSPYIQQNKDLESSLNQLTYAHQTYSEMLKHGATDTQIAANETDIYQQRIEALKNHQDSLHQTNDQIRADMEQIKQKMNALNPSGTDVTNLSQGQQDALKSLSQEYDKLSQQADQNSTAWGRDQKEITSATLDWLNALYQLEDNGLKPLSNQMHQNDLDLKQLQNEMKLYSNEIKNQGNDTKSLTAYTTDYHKEVTLLTDQNNLLHQSNDQLRSDNDNLRDQMNLVQQQYDSGQTTVDAYDAAMQSLSDQIQKNTDKISENSDKVYSNMDAVKQAADQMNQINFDQANSSIKDMIQNLKDLAKDQLQTIDNQIRSIDQQLSDMQWNNQVQDNSQKLADLQQQANQWKNSTSVEGRKKYEDYMKQISDLQTTMNRDNAKHTLETQKQNLEDQKNAINQHFNDLYEIYNGFSNNVKSIDKVLQDTLKANAKETNSTIKGYLTDTINTLQNLQKQMQGTVTGGSSNGSQGTSGQTTTSTSTVSTLTEGTDDNQFQIQNDRAIMQSRQIASLLGISSDQVSWDDSSGTVSIAGHEFNPAKNDNGTTYLYLSDVLNGLSNLGYGYQWDDSSRTIKITKTTTSTTPSTTSNSQGSSSGSNPSSGINSSSGSSGNQGGSTSNGSTNWYAGQGSGSAYYGGNYGTGSYPTSSNPLGINLSLLKQLLYFDQNGVISKSDLESLQQITDYIVTKGYTPPNLSQLDSFDTGGYTGTWSGGQGRPVLVHQKELILKEGDTANLLSAIQLIRTPSVTNFNVPQTSTPQPISIDVKVDLDGAQFNNKSDVDYLLNQLDIKMERQLTARLRAAGIR